MSTTERDLIHISPQEGPDIMFSQSSGIITQVGESNTDAALTLEGGIILPALTDAHDHVVADAYSHVLRDPSLLGVLDKQTALARIRDECEARIQAGYSGYILFRKAIDTLGLTAEDLDSVSQGLPIAVFDPSNHGGIANSRALAEIHKEALLRSNGDLSRIHGECVDDGRITDHYGTIAKNLAISSVTDEQLKDALASVLESRLECGTTAVHDMGVRSARDLKVIKQLKLEWEAERNMPFPITRAYIMHLGVVGPDPVDEIAHALETGDLTVDDLEWIGIKYLADGAFGSHSAHLKDPYSDAEKLSLQYPRGYSTVDSEEVVDVLERAAALGISEVAVHAIGDQAIDTALDIAEQWQLIAREFQLDPTRYRIEHCEYPYPLESTLQRAKDMGIWIGLQPNFLAGDYNYEDRLGFRVSALSPHAVAHAMEMKMTFGTDRMPASPLFAIACAVHAVFGTQRLTFEEALRYFTETPADFEGSPRGRLEVGQRADVVVFDASLHEVMQKTAELLDRSHDGENVEGDVAKLVAALHGCVQHVFVAGKQVR